MMGGIKMGKYLIMVSSITYAIKGRDLLRNNKFKAYIEKTPSSLDSHGCGYSIIIYNNLDEALNILTKHNIKIIGHAER